MLSVKVDTVGFIWVKASTVISKQGLQKSVPNMKSHM